MGVVINERGNADGSTSWRVVWNRRREDRPRSVYLGTWPEKKYAEARRNKALLMLASGEEPSRRALDRVGVLTVDGLLDKWLASQHDGEGTKAKKLIIAAKIRRKWGEKAPANITKDDVQGWINEMVAEGKARGTIQNHLNVLRPLLREADIDPVWLRGTRVLNLPKKKLRKLNLPDEARRAGARAHLASPQYQAIFDICLHGGTRASEPCDLLRGEIGVFEGHPAIVQVGTKWVDGEEKKPRNVRHMPELDQPMWVPERGEGPDDERIFPGTSGKAFGRALARACKNAGVKPFTPNDLRHLHATRLSFHQGTKHRLGLHAMAKRMGHSQALFHSTYSDHPLPDSE